MTEFETIAYLRSPMAIRDRCNQIFTLGCADKLSHFRCNLDRLEKVADYVIQVIYKQYPDLNIPFHSRWRHFEVGNIPRITQMDEAISGLNAVQKAQIKFDLAIISVLLDAGAGAEWYYCEPETQQVFQRSEGLAVASFRMFCSGTFSSNPEQPMQADAFGLQQLTESKLAQGFQVGALNPLVGLSGRLELLQRLGQVLHSAPQLFGDHNPRPGNLVNYLLSQSCEGQLAAKTVLSAVLAGLSDIWPGRYAIAGVNLGDVWHHPALQGNGISDAVGGCVSEASVFGLAQRYVPFHKLSQWLTYSLLEPLQELNLEITGLEMLTGLPEYRNGGLCLDLGLLQAKHSAVLSDRHLPGSEIIVEWRSLTVSLLDRIAEVIRQKLGMSATELPLVKILQGGTWSAGRQIAAELRDGGIPPIQIVSDGTVF